MANPALIKMLGYSSFEELAARNLEKEGFEPSYPRNRFKELIESQGEVTGLEAAWTRKDGSAVFVRENAKAIRDEKGDILYFEGTVENITERKKAEEALQESEQRFRTLFETTREALVTADPDGKIQSANPAAARMLGYDSAVDLEGMYTSQFYTNPEQREAVLKELKDEGCVEDFEISVRRKAGSDAHILLSITTQRDEQGNILRTDGIFRDITERKRAEEALRDSEQRLKEAQVMGRIGNWEFDIDSQTLNWSDQVFKLYERDPAFGPPTSEEEATYYTPEQAKILREYAQRTIETGEEFKYDLEAKLLSGKSVHFSASMRPIKDKHGRVIRLFGTVQDITERKQAEELLRETTQTLEAVIQASPLPIFVLDRERIVKMWNPAAERTFGWGAKEVIGRQYPAIPKEKMDEADALFMRALESGLTEVETLRQRKDGSLIDVYISAAPLRDGRGNINGVMAIIADITERKRAEEEVRKLSQYLESVIDNANVWLDVLDEKANVTIWNKAAEQISGYT